MPIHHLLTLSITDVTEATEDVVIDATLNSLAEVYPHNGDPVFITPQATVALTPVVLAHLLDAAERGMAAAHEDEGDSLTIAVNDVITVLRAGLASIR